MNRARLRRLPSAMRLALVLSALFTGSAILAGMVAYVVMSDELRFRLFDDARLEANALVAESRNSSAEELARQIRIVSAIGDAHSTLYFFQPAGGGAAVGNMVPRALFQGARVLTAGQEFVLLPDPGDQVGEVYFAYGVQAPSGWIVVARNSQWITDSQEVLVQAIAWGLGVALIATILLALVLGRRSMRRVARLNRVLAAVSDGDLAARFHLDGNPRDDLDEVAQGINAMLERLEANVERLTQVSADIAHDLRSPLTHLRLRLEPHALRRDLPEETRDAIARSLESLDAVSSSFDAILQLSQMETGNMTLQTAAVDLREIARHVHEMLLPVAEEAGHQFDLTVPDSPVRVTASRDLLTQALVNLAENALCHVPPHSRIQIAITQERDQVCLSVSDNGLGIPSQERDKVTRRFYRLDRSRSRPGTGLGLSIVGAIARLHGGSLKLADNAPGLYATICLHRAE